MYRRKLPLRIKSDLRADGLTRRQRQVLVYILDCWLHGYLPAMREIMEQLEVKSPNGVFAHIKALRRKGWLRQSDHKHALRLAEKSIHSVLGEYP